MRLAGGVEALGGLAHPRLPPDQQELLAPGVSAGSSPTG